MCWGMLCSIWQLIMGFLSLEPYGTNPLLLLNQEFLTWGLETGWCWEDVSLFQVTFFKTLECALIMNVAESQSGTRSACDFESIRKRTFLNENFFVFCIS